MSVVINIKNLHVRMPHTSKLFPVGMGVMTENTDTPAVPQIGQPWPEQGGVLAGMMPAEDGHPAYYLIVPTDTAAEAESLEWGGRGHQCPESSSWDGKKNTEQLKASDNKHPAAEFCSGLSLGGVTDWYLPSRREASLIAATVPQLFGKGWYWTSTQSSAYSAFIQIFDDGYQTNSLKNGEGRVRAVRRVIPLSL